MTGDTETAFQPPYMAWSTFENILEDFRTVGLPGRIDRSVLRGKSGGDQSQFIRAAQRFGLISDDGVPTARMQTLVREPERRPEPIRTILTECYGDVVALGTDATPQQLHEAFRAFGIEGDTVRKAEAFYLNAARLAEIPLSPHFAATRPGAGGRRGARRKPAATKSQNNAGNSEQSAPAAPFGGLHPAVVTLVQALPSASPEAGKPVFSNAEREAWFAYAKATFNLIYALPEGDAGGD